MIQFTESIKLKGKGFWTKNNLRARIFIFFYFFITGGHFPVTSISYFFFSRNKLLSNGAVSFVFYFEKFRARKCYVCNLCDFPNLTKSYTILYFIIYIVIKVIYVMQDKAQQWRDNSHQQRHGHCFAHLLFRGFCFVEFKSILKLNCRLQIY